MKSIRTGLSLAWISVLILGLVLTACSGSPGDEIVYYEETKILTEEEAENIEEVTENRTRILFREITAFVAGLGPGDVLVSEHPVPGAEYGFLERVTGVSTTEYGFLEGVTGLTNGGTVVEIEPATLEDAIEEGVILVTETIPLEDLLNDALWAMGVEVLQVQEGYQFSYIPAEGVTIEGYLLFTADADVHIKARFLRGLEEFEFIFSPGLEMEATLRVEQGIEWDEKYTIATIPGPPIPIWGPVTITPEIELVVGTTGTVDASLEATVTHDRVYDVGLKYDGSWTTISDMSGEGATLEEPSFSGHGEALVFGGVVLSGTAGGSYVAEASLEAELLGNIRASGEIENSPWRWQYDLELYLSAQVFADLNLLRIAHVSWESDLWEYPDPPYNLAYGASGRVTTEGGEGLDGVEINFSGGHSSVTSNTDGYWCKHLLRGEVEATPEKTGYTFDPPSMTITGSASDLDFQAFGEEEAVYFPDPNLEAVIREATGKATGPIYPSDLEGLTSLHADQRNISELTGLEHCTSLTDLYLWVNQISDISPLSNLTNLTLLDLHSNQISDISPLANLTNLTLLDLDDNQISDISPLANLTSLTGLGLSGNQISDISPLSNFTNLIHLTLGGNQISDILALANLTNLAYLYLHFNQISDISPLANLTNLTYLHLDGNQISDISPLANLTNLTQLSLWDNQISDISPLSNFTNLTVLYLRSNQISDISPLANLTNLIHLDLSVNQISDISPLSNFTNLTLLYLRSNQISDISPLVNLTNLTWLNLSDSQISDIEPLVNNPGLSQGDRVYLTNNPLSDTSINTYIPQLEARGVLVVY